MKTIFKYIFTLIIMIGLDFLYLFLYMDKQSFELEPFIVFLGIEFFIALFISKLRKFLAA